MSRCRQVVNHVVDLMLALALRLKLNFGNNSQWTFFLKDMNVSNFPIIIPRITLFILALFFTYIYICTSLFDPHVPFTISLVGFNNLIGSVILCDRLASIINIGPKQSRDSIPLEAHRACVEKERREAC